MSTPLKEESRLIGDIYDAAMDTSLWPGIMTTIALRTQAEKARIMAMDILNPACDVMFSHNIPVECFAEYREQRWDQVDMGTIGAGGLAKFGLGVPYNASSLFDSAEAQREALGGYHDFLGKWGMSAQAVALLDQGDFRWSAVGVHRPEEMGSFDVAALAFLARMAPHLRRSLQIHRRLTAVKSGNTSLLRDSFQLSPREIDICQQFISTPDLHAIAENSGLSLETVRTYLKVIYEKTGQHSQAELMRLLMGLRADFEPVR